MSWALGTSHRASFLARCLVLSEIEPLLSVLRKTKTLSKVKDVVNSGLKIISVWLPRLLRISRNSQSRGGRNMAEPRFKPGPILLFVVEEMVLAQRISGRMNLGSDVCGI